MQEAVTTLRNHLLKRVNLAMSMSMDEFLGIKQGNKTFSTFLAGLKKKATVQVTDTRRR